ncbi:hypothetical protein F7734_02900 [Scytonema sp. UIC 10036]|nr:hypothetical protein [Scytonema sp. UIC 10036]MUG91492.1 hypothetical protein [Scytonema sp. UIC 10036]
MPRIGVIVKEVIELLSVYDWETFRQVLKLVALDITSRSSEELAGCTAV